MKSIKIPVGGRVYTQGTMFHVMFPFEREIEFNQWCEKNNIGYGPNDRTDVVKSDCHVFCKKELAAKIFKF